MKPSNLICIFAIVFLNVGAEIINAINENQLEDLGSSRLLQELQVNRQKRSYEDGSCKGSDCKKEAVVGSQPIVVNHYHNYYYNCPCVPNQLPKPTPRSSSPVSSPESTCVDCSCGKSGAISCTVSQNPRSGNPQTSGTSYQHSPQTGGNTYQQNFPSADQKRVHPSENQRKDLTNKDKNTAFSFSLLFDDPVAKDFYDFVTTNFVKRDTPLEIAEISCQTDPLTILEDPICKEFFNLFTQSFVRKAENTTSAPELLKSSTQKPSYASSSRRPRP